jgi:cytochrome bd-type quinol oxidase subunit 2
MKLTAVAQLRGVTLLALLGLLLVLAGSVTNAATAVSEKRDPPALLWKTYPLKERATAQEVTTISGALGILNARTAGQQLARNPAGQRSLVMIVLLGLAMLLLGIATLPQVVFPDPRVADFLARRRTEVTATGAALLLVILIAFLLG